MNQNKPTIVSKEFKFKGKGNKRQMETLYTGKKANVNIHRYTYSLNVHKQQLKICVQKQEINNSN